MHVIRFKLKDYTEMEWERRGIKILFKKIIKSLSIEPYILQINGRSPQGYYI